MLRCIRRDCRTISRSLKQAVLKLAVGYVVQADVQNEASVEAALLKLDSLITYLQPKMPQPRLCQKRLKDKFRPTLDSKIWGALHVVKHALLISEWVNHLYLRLRVKGYPGFALAGAANAGIEGCS